MVGSLLGGLVYVNILVVMLFGVVLGFVVVVVLVIGSVMIDCMEEEGYFWFFSVVFNIMVFIIGLFILFSNVLIVYVLVSGGVVLVVVLFVVGYVLGILVGVVLMIVVVIIVWKEKFCWGEKIVVS